MTKAMQEMSGYSPADLRAQIHGPVPRLASPGYRESLPLDVSSSRCDLGMPDELADRSDAVVLEVFATGQPAEETFQYTSPHGPQRLHARIVPEVENERVVHVWGVVRDVTSLD